MSRRQVTGSTQAIYRAQAAHAGGSGRRHTGVPQAVGPVSQTQAVLGHLSIGVLLHGERHGAGLLGVLCAAAEAAVPSAGRRLLLVSVCLVAVLRADRRQQLPSAGRPSRGR